MTRSHTASRRSWTRVAVAWGLPGALVIGVGWFVWSFSRGDLSRGDQIASVVGLFVGLAGIGVAAWSLWEQRRHSATVLLNHSGQVDRAAEVLAEIVAAQWKAEAAVRSLRQSPLLQVSWNALSEATGPTSRGVAGRRTRRARQRELRGDLVDLTNRFRDLPNRRLVVVGAPGSGKTALATLLTLALLDQRHQHDLPVPVLLPLGSWDPSAEHLDTWLARRLGEEYPALGSPAFGRDAAQRLTKEDRILPVLDGLDELPEALLANAIDELGRARPCEPLVVTCRGEEYRQAVAVGGRELAADLVVELQPVAVDAAVRFLRAPSGSMVTPAAARWESVAAHLRADPVGPLARALDTPLMVALARAVYTGAGYDPSTLVGLARIGGEAAVKGHLLEQFVSVVYTPRPPPPGTSAFPYKMESPELPRGWLVWLGSCLHGRHTHDLAWWHLPRLLPARTTRLVIGLVLGLAVWVAVGLVFGLVFGLGGGPAFGLIFGPIDGLVVGVAAGLMAGLASGVAAGFAVEPAAVPTRVYARIRGRLAALTRSLTGGLLGGVLGGLTFTFIARSVAFLPVRLPLGLGLGLVIGLASGLAAGFLVEPAAVPARVYARIRGRLATLTRSLTGGLLVGLLGGLIFGLALRVAFRLAYGLDEGEGGPVDWLREWLKEGVTARLTVGITVGITVGFMGGLWNWLQRPVDDALAVTSSSVLRSDGIVALVRGLGFGAAVGLTVGLASESTVGPVLGLACGVGGGLMTGLTAGLVGTAWGQFTIVRFWLALRGRLPWRLMAFLDDAHRRGILRQVGAVYQFRHEQLRDHLAAASATNTTP